MKAADILSRIESHHRAMDAHTKGCIDSAIKLAVDEEAIEQLLRGKLRGKALLFHRGNEQWEVITLRGNELVHTQVVWAHEADAPEPVKGGLKPPAEAVQETRTPDTRPCGVCRSNGSVHEFLIGGQSPMNQGR